MEARAHIAVQQWIDAGGLEGRRALTSEGLQETHQRFCGFLPDDLLWIEDPKTKERVRVIPGELRRRDVQVGRLVAVSPGALPRFLRRFEEVYGKVGRTESIISMAGAHHRFLWMHPFLDGNGRVARLMSHATLLDVLDTGAVWSVSRGLARNVQEYKSHLAACDSGRRNDLDGRGALSEEALAAFTEFFLTVCIDQVTFMQSLIQPDRLRARILIWAEEETRIGALPPKAGNILEALLYRGQLPRGDVDAITGTGERQARRIVADLVKAGVIGSDNPRARSALFSPQHWQVVGCPDSFPTNRRDIALASRTQQDATESGCRVTPCLSAVAAYRPYLRTMGADTYDKLMTCVRSRVMRIRQRSGSGPFLQVSSWARIHDTCSGPTITRSVAVGTSHSNALPLTPGATPESHRRAIRPKLP